jgi:hypothetical protein
LLCTSERMSGWQCGDAWWSRLIFFHYERTEFHYAKATKSQEFGKPTYLAWTKQAASCTEHTGFRQKASKTIIPSTTRWAMIRVLAAKTMKSTIYYKSRSDGVGS